MIWAMVLVPSAPVTSLFIACDFDGTITERDTLHLIVEEYGDRALWDDFEPQLRSGSMTVEEALERQFRSVYATNDDVHRLVEAQAPVRAGFARFVEWGRAAGHEIVVISNGFRSVIEPVLHRAGVELPLVANDADFARSGTTLIWDDRGRRCGVCHRPCKREPIHARSGGRQVVVIGDGISDRCGAGLADIVFARAGLAEDLRAQGRDFVPFDDFDDVILRLAGVEATG